jgi:hypothetical protein
MERQRISSEKNSIAFSKKIEILSFAELPCRAPRIFIKFFIKMLCRFIYSPSPPAGGSGLALDLPLVNMPENIKKCHF